MGLISGIYGMVRQSQQDDLNEKRVNQDMELKQRYYEKQMQQYNDTNKRRDAVYSGVKELAELDNTIGETSFQKTMLEQRLEQSALKDPEEAKRYMIEGQVVAKTLETLQNTRKVKSAEVMYRSIDADFAKSKALDLADFLSGKKPSESGLATITKKRKILDEDGMDTGEVETVTMKVPQSQVGYGGYVGGQDKPQPQSSYNPYSMAEAVVDSSAPLGDATPEYARPYAPEQSQGMLMRDIANVPVQSPAQDQSQVMQAQPQEDTEAVRQQALIAMSKARTPDQRQRVKDRAAKYGVELP